MKEVFADSGYWIALINPRDNLHAIAEEASKSLGKERIVTSEMVLVEVLNGFGEKGFQMRRLVAGTTEKIMGNPNVEVVPQTSVLFKKAFDMYKNREDKDWSLTDCASFVVMQERGISRALAYDEHFTQAGFEPLLKDK